MSCFSPLILFENCEKKKGNINGKKWAVGRTAYSEVNIDGA
jgi:hypothetical protein